MLLICGVACLLAGGVLVAGAAVVQSALDAEGRMYVSVGTIPAGDARTLVMDIDRYSAAPGLLGPLGQARLAFRSPAGPLQVGVGDSAEVDSELRGSTYAVARRDEGAWQTTAVPGVAAPRDVSSQGSWLDRATGAAPEIAIPSHRPLTLVVSGPTALDDVMVDAVVEVQSHRAIVLSLVAVGLVLLAIGVLLVVLGARGRSSRARHAATEDAARA